MGLWLAKRIGQPGGSRADLWILGGCRTWVVLVPSDRGIHGRISLFHPWLTCLVVPWNCGPE